MLRSPNSHAPGGSFDRVEHIDRGFVLRSTTTDDLKAYLAGPVAPEMARLSPARQFEEAWFLGLRMNQGVNLIPLTQEFGPEMIELSMQTVERLVDDGLLIREGDRIQLTSSGRLLSNDVFQEFLEPQAAAAVFEA
jgi:oxygen-independent coproporphyrinogen-3 oxidase